jgi:hypothetical protein
MIIAYKFEDYISKKNKLVLSALGNTFSFPIDYEKLGIYEITHSGCPANNFSELRKFLAALSDTYVKKLQTGTYTLYITSWPMSNYTKLLSVLHSWATHTNICNKIQVIIPINSTPYTSINTNKVEIQYVNSITYTIAEIHKDNFVGYGVQYYYDKILDIEKKPINKYFSCYSYSPKVHRLLMYSLLNKYGLTSKGSVTWNSTGALESKQHFSRNDFDHRYSILFTKKVPITMDEFLVYYNQNNPYLLSNNFWLTIMHLYKPFLEDWYSSAFNIVMESTHFNRDFITEKTYVNFLLGDVNSLNHLKDYHGFKTFNSIWSEEYNSRDTVDSCLLAFKEIYKLCQLPLSVLQEKIQQVDDIVEHNYNTFMNIPHTQYIRNILPIHHT